jgi:head-tail adaptor
VITLQSHDLDHRLRIERPIADESFRGAGSGEWELVDTVWASVIDSLPSRGEQGGTATMLTRPARVRIRYREDVTAAMRFVEGDRIMVITAGPAIVGRRSGVEFAVAEYLPGGNAA